MHFQLSATSNNFFQKDIFDNRKVHMHTFIYCTIIYNFSNQMSKHMELVKCPVIHAQWNTM